MADKQPPPYHFTQVHPWLAVCGGAAVVILAALTGVAYATQGQAIVRGVTIAGQDVGGLDKQSAQRKVQKQWDVFTSQALSFSGGDQEFTIPVGTGGTAEEVIVDIVGLDIEAAVNKAVSFGHRGSLWRQARERLSGWLGREHRFGTLIFDAETLHSELQRELADREQAPVNAGLTVTSPTEFSLIPSATGTSFDYAGAISQARRKLRRLHPAGISVQSVIVQPEISSQPGMETIAAGQIPTVLNKAPITVTYDEKTWTIDQEQIKGLLGWARQGRNVVVSFDAAKTTVWLEKIKPDVEQAAQNAKFSIIDGKVQEFQASAIGRAIDISGTINRMRSDIIEKNGTTSTLVVVETKPITDTTSTNDLGITELVAEGRTNFRGSPTNRKYNLTFGSQKLNGLLIAPGETFSLVTALGKIDAKNGWKPELVIKGTKITPEYGGGLCQVATTLFRAVLNTGLPVVERRNHSLRISYYEPPIGLDATIYEPKPDLRFTNDYAGYLLLQTRIEGTELIYSFYGTKDGRKVDLPEPRVYNRTGIPPTKNIEVDDLKPGEKECQAPGHPGADATATYTVSKVDGTSVTQTFQSHYRPIPVICRIGKKVDS